MYIWNIHVLVNYKIFRIYCVVWCCLCCNDKTWIQTIFNNSKDVQCIHIIHSIWQTVDFIVCRGKEMWLIYCWKHAHQNQWLSLKDNHFMKVTVTAALVQMLYRYNIHTDTPDILQWIPNRVKRNENEKRKKRKNNEQYIYIYLWLQHEQNKQKKEKKLNKMLLLNLLLFLMPDSSYLSSIHTDFSH